MKPGTNYVTQDKRITENDYRSPVGLTDYVSEPGKTSDGWAWVAALVVAALFIISGYFDQESRNDGRTTSSGAVHSYPSSTSSAQVLVANAGVAVRHFDKGY